MQTVNESSECVAKAHLWRYLLHQHCAVDRPATASKVYVICKTLPDIFKSMNAFFKIQLHICSLHKDKLHKVTYILTYCDQMILILIAENLIWDCNYGEGIQYILGQIFIIMKSQMLIAFAVQSESSFYLMDLKSCLSHIFTSLLSYTEDKRQHLIQVHVRKPTLCMF